MYIINQTALLRVSLIFILIISSVIYSFSQVTDSASITTTTAHKDTLVKNHSPQKATIMSVCLPGLGQVYNKKYWKVPVLYAGLAALGYAFYQSQTLYVNYRDAYKNRLLFESDPKNNNPDPYYKIYSDNVLFNIQQQFHRDRDLSVIGLGLLYMINIVDASVDAHLFNFDVSDDLSLNIQPRVMYIASANYYQTGLSLSLKF